MRRVTRSVGPLAWALAPGLLVALPAAGAVLEASERASWSTLGRDQGIFQYVAWASAHGHVLYRDVRDVNGPLIALLHRAALALGGTDEHRFRVLDLVVTALAAMLAGGCLAALSDRAALRGERVARALGLGLGAWAALSAQYLGYGFWDTAQRESFCDWFVLASVGLQIVGQSRLRRDACTVQGRRDGAILLAVAGAASVIAWFGKPTYALFTVGQLLALAADHLALGRARRTALVLAGGAVGASVPLAFLLFAGDARAWARITFVDVPAMYRFIWPRPFRAILEVPAYGAMATYAALASLAVVALVGAKLMPRRALVLAVMPLAGLASVAIQAKGFGYHFHPVSTGTALALVALVHAAWVRAEASGRSLAYVAAGALAIALGGRSYLIAARAPFPAVPLQRDGVSLASREHLAAYDRVDFFPSALRAGADYVAANTGEHDTVQTYGMDPYVLFLAGRLSATPYIYAYDLDADAALEGGSEPGAPRPNEDQRRVILAMRDAHERDLLARMQARPPAAFLFIDRSPLMRTGDAERDFELHCPSTWAWLNAHYRESAAFDEVHVWLANP
jgi:hypothetical protein